MPGDEVPVPAPGPRARLGYQPQLDGVRALAVFAVVAAHTGADSLRGGALGVDVFFVLSGFLITTILVDEFDRDGDISLRQFYRRRLARLLPALVVVLLFAAVAFAAIRPYLASETLVGVPASLLYVSSWFRAFDISQLGWLGHTWSLSVEEHFYLLWPIVVLLLCRRARHNLVPLVGGLFVAAALYRAIWQAAGASGARLYNSPDMRAEQLLAGCLLAVLLLGVRAVDLGPWLHRAFTVAFAGSVVILVALMAIPNHYVAPRLFDGTASTYFVNGISTLIAALAAVIIGHLVLWPGSWVARLLALPPLGWLGRRAYGIYLWHVPLFGLAFLKGRPDSLRFSVRIALIFVTIAVAAVSYRYIEAPLLARYPSRQRRGPVKPVGTSARP